ncbi:MAG: DUF3047 domain-containing protein [Lentisphaeria bacterium]
MPKPLLIVIICVFAVSAVMADENSEPGRNTEKAGTVAVRREDFDDLDAWKPRTFEDVKRHTQYSIVKQNGESYLKSFTDHSASGLVCKDKFDVYKYPRLRWCWKVSNIFEKGDATSKKSDDYANRVYVSFEYDPDDVGWVTRAKYRVAKQMYGEYPPHSVLNYFWANKDHGKDHLVSQYTDRAMLIPVEVSKANVGEWVIEEVNILEDYQRVFGKKPPRTPASLAIMSDSDNTGESATGYIDFIEILPPAD